MNLIKDLHRRAWSEAISLFVHINKLNLASSPIGNILLNGPQEYD